MKAITRILAAAALAVPFAVGAQSSTTTTTPKGVTPPDQPTSQTEKEAQSKTGQANKASGLSGAENMPNRESSRTDKAHTNTMRHDGTTQSRPTDPSTYPTTKDGTTTKQ